MVDFWQTFAIAVIPSALTALLSYFAASKSSATQIKAIQEQNKADIEKLIQQNKVDIESLKEKHQLEMQMKEKEYQHQIDMVKLQHENELKTNEENMKNQLAANAIGGFVNGLFSQESPITSKINEALVKGIEDAMKEK